MADVTSTRRIQILRNQLPKNNINFFIGGNGLWKQPEFINQLKDGEQVLGRYKKSDGTLDTLYGIAHIFGPTDNRNYIEVFKSGLGNNQYGNGIIVNSGKIEARLSENGGLEFDPNAAEGVKGFGVKTSEHIKSDVNGLSVERDDVSIVSNADNALEVGIIDCEAWDATPTV